MFPRLFSIPTFGLFGYTSVGVPTYGVILAIAFIVGLWVVAREARRYGLDPVKVTDLAVYTLIGGLVGAKLLLLLVEFDYYWRNPREILSIVRSGGVFYGGLLGGFAVGAWYTIRHRMPVWSTLDIVAPPVVLGQAIGRWGCLAAGCCFGKETKVPWAVIYRSIEARTVDTPLDSPRHPAPVYESLACLAIFVILLAVARRRRFNGQVLMAYLALYSVARFGLEYFRADARGSLFHGALSTSQFIAILVLLAAIAVTPYLARKQRIVPEDKDPKEPAAATS